jgi:hypothetical protein
LTRQLGSGELTLVCDLDSEEWDLLNREQVQEIALL